MFNILHLIEQELNKNEIFIEGMSHNPFRIDFKTNEYVSPETIDLAHSIAENMLENESQLKQEWEDQQKKIITSEKAALLVNILIQKGIMTEEEANSIF